MREAKACKEEDVDIVGGANSAGQAAMFFSKYARRVIILVRGDSLKKSMSKYLIDQIEQTPNIEVRARSRVVEVDGETHLECLTILNDSTGEKTRVPASSLFVFIGAAPRTECLDGVVERDERGFILAGRDLIRDGKRPRGSDLDRDPYLLETSVPGIFVAGDVRHGSVKRLAAGLGVDSIALQF